MLVASYSYHTMMTEIIEIRKNLIGKTKSLNVHDTFWQISLEPSNDQCSQTLTSNVVSSNSDCHDFDFRGNTHRESQIWIMGHFLCKFKQKNFFLSYIMCLSLLLEAYSLFRYMPNDCYVFQTLLEWLIKLIYPPTPKIAKKNNRHWLSSELTD